MQQQRIENRLEQKQYQGLKVRSSSVFYTFADQDVAQFFIQLIKEEHEQQDGDIQKRNEQDEQKHETDCFQIIDAQTHQGFENMNNNQLRQDKNEHISRLQIEIQKNNLQITPVYGEIFIKIIQTQLFNHKKNQRGLLLLTNYRLAFFKFSKKKIDLPFGFIDSVKINQKQKQCLVFLKHGHCWKFIILKQAAIQQIHVFLTIYLKSQNCKSNFAYAYGQKCPNSHLNQEQSISNQYNRIKANQTQKIQQFHNKNYELCESYPATIYIPKQQSKRVSKISKFWNLNRLPILSYIYSQHFNNGAKIWRSSHIIADRTQNLTEVAKYFEHIKEQKQYLYVYDCSGKSLKKCIQQKQVYPHCIMKHLDLDHLNTIKNSYLSAIQCFLNQKKCFIKDLLASKWYDGIINILKGVSNIVNTILMGNNCLIKCSDGRERSSQICALVQIIIQPYYRTFRGFAVLIKKQFTNFGYPFSTRLGMKSQKDENIPMFIQFLDCVTQLVNCNTLSFQFNHKFLSKLSNLMYTNLFGTFIGQCEKQRVQNKTQSQTIPIWNQLNEEITINPYYQQKQGLLTIPQNYNQIRVWKQHFWYLTTPPKQSYKMNPLAEDNHDYKSLACLQIKRSNDKLRQQIYKQRNRIQELRAQLDKKKNIK